MKNTRRWKVVLKKCIEVLEPVSSFHQLLLAQCLRFKVYSERELRAPKLAADRPLLINTGPSGRGFPSYQVQHIEDIIPLYSTIFEQCADFIQEVNVQDQDKVLDLLNEQFEEQYFNQE